MKKLTKIVIGLSVIIVFFIVVTRFSDYNNEKLMRERISEEFRGLVLDKFSTRETKTTFVKLKTTDGIKDVSINSETMNRIQVGDSLIKKGNSKYGFLIKSDGQKFKVPLFNKYVLEKY
jgi:hypothetical protein